MSNPQCVRVAVNLDSSLTRPCTSNAEPGAFHADSSNLISARNGVMPLRLPLYILPGREQSYNGIATCLASGLRTNAAQSSPILPPSYIDVLCNSSFLNPLTHQVLQAALLFNRLLNIEV